jgi:hypothetical protein
VKRRLLIILVAMFLAFQIMALQIQNGRQSSPPVALFTFSPDIPAAGDIITFDASASYDPDGSIVQYRWNFGDGTSAISNSEFAAHSFPADGYYTVELTAVDNSGNSAEATAIIEVSTVVFFRVVILGTLTPVSNVRLTTYYYDGTAWVTAPTGPSKFEIKYDNMTQPDLANTATERFRNPGFTASILREGASNIGTDIHPSCWKVYFKFQWGSYVAYWPNEATRVYCYDNGAVETYDYNPGHEAYWDPTASTYVINVNDIHNQGVSPTQSHPIIVGISYPLPVQKYSLAVVTSPPGITTIAGAGEYVAGTNVTLTAPANIAITSSSQYRFDHWDVDGVSRGAGVDLITANMNANHTATAHYVTQYAVTFNQTGLNSDATGTVVTVNGSPKTISDLPYNLWADAGCSMTYSYATSVSSSTTGKRYRSNAVTGLISPITVTSPSTVIGSYVVQYLISFSQTGLDSAATGTVVTVNGTAKTYSDLTHSWWVDTGSTVVYSYSSTVSSSTLGERFSLVTVHDSPEGLIISSPTTISGEYCTQFRVTFSQSGLDSTAQGTVVSIDGSLYSYLQLPFDNWVRSGSTISYSYNTIVLSSTGNKQFYRTTVTGPASPITVTSPATVTGSYKIQYHVTFDDTGVGTEFTGTVVTIDSVAYNVGSLPVSFWYDQNSNHNFAFSSPLTVNASLQYSWSSTTGLSALQSGAITVTTSGSLTGNYAVGNRIAFDITGVSSGFMSTIVTVDGNPYDFGQLPVSFIWQTGTIHNFSFQSPLNVGINNTRYVWISTSGLSAVQTGSVTVSTFGSIIGNYKTQYYLALPPNPPELIGPSGSGWYDAGTFASVSTQQYQPGGSRYRFDRWQTADMSEIVDPYSPTTTILIDKPKTVTALYVHQYLVTFYQNGISSDAVGTVLTVNSTTNTYADLPYSIWVDEGNVINYVFQSNIDSTTGGKRFSLTGVTGPASPITVNSDTDLTGNYTIQYRLSVSSPFGTVTGEGWYEEGSVAYAALNVGIIDHGDGTRHAFAFWSGDASGTDYSQSSPISMNAPKSAVANWKIQYQLTLTTTPASITSPAGAGWYDLGDNAPISTTAFVDIIPGSSRYRFNGWTTDHMGEIVDPTRSPTTVTMDEAKTVTANYVTQYFVTFGQNGVNSDFTGTIVTIDSQTYNFTSLSAGFWWDDASSHTFNFASPLTVSLSKRYDWASTAGLSTSQSGTVVVSATGSVTGNYNSVVTYTLTIQATAGGSTNPTVGTYTHQAGADVQVGAIPSSSYEFDHWELDGVNKGPFTPYSVYMDGGHTLKAFFRVIPAPLTTTITPSSASIQPGQSVGFTSSTAGGTSPYTYQWYLNGNPAAGATSSSWIFTPPSTGTYSVYLKVTDSLANNAQSSVARVTVTAIPVGGYSVSTAKQPNTLPIAFCATLVILGIAVALVLMRRRKD